MNRRKGMFRVREEKPANAPGERPGQEARELKP